MKKSKIYVSVLGMLGMLLVGCSDKTPQTAENIDVSTSNKDSLVLAKFDVSDASNDKNTSAHITNTSTVYFEFDKYKVSGQDIIKLSEYKNKVNPTTIRLEGNCDSFGTDEYNMALGLKRANAVKNILVQNGVNENSITMISYGENNAVCLEQTAECWAKNRRVNIIGNK